MRGGTRLATTWISASGANLDSKLLDLRPMTTTCRRLLSALIQYSDPVLPCPPPLPLILACLHHSAGYQSMCSNRGTITATPRIR